MYTDTLLDKVAAVVANAWGVTVADLRSRKNDQVTKLTRHLFVELAADYHPAITLRTISEYLGRSQGYGSDAREFVAVRLGKSVALRREMELMREQLKSV